MATKPRKPTTPMNRCAALYTHVGELLFIRGNPTTEDVKEFILEHNRRYHAGEPGGPSGIPAFKIHKASFFNDEFDAKDGLEGEEIDLSGILPQD